MNVTLIVCEHDHCPDLQAFLDSRPELRLHGWRQEREADLSTVPDEKKHSPGVSATDAMWEPTGAGHYR